MGKEGRATRVQSEQDMREQKREARSTKDWLSLFASLAEVNSSPYSVLGLSFLE